MTSTESSTVTTGDQTGEDAAMSDEMARKPRRRIVFIAKIEADSWDRLSDELAHMSREVDRGFMRSTSISGGYSCGHIVVASEDGSMDHDKWFKELTEYLERERAGQ